MLCIQTQTLPELTETQSKSRYRQRSQGVSNLMRYWVLFKNRYTQIWSEMNNYQLDSILLNIPVDLKFIFQPVNSASRKTDLRRKRFYRFQDKGGGGGTRNEEKRGSWTVYWVIFGWGKSSSQFLFLINGSDHWTRPDGGNTKRRGEGNVLEASSPSLKREGEREGKELRRWIPLPPLQLHMFRTRDHRTWGACWPWLANSSRKGSLLMPFKR